MRSPIVILPGVPKPKHVESTSVIRTVAAIAEGRALERRAPAVALSRTIKALVTLSIAVAIIRQSVALRLRDGIGKPGDRHQHWYRTCRHCTRGQPTWFAYRDRQIGSQFTNRSPQPDANRLPADLVRRVPQLWPRAASVFLPHFVELPTSVAGCR